MQAPTLRRAKPAGFRRPCSPLKLAFLFCAFWVVINSSLAQSVDTVYIAVQARWLTGDPISYLRAQDFRVTVLGKPVAAMVVQSPATKRSALKTPTFVVLLFGPDYKGGSSEVETVLREIPISLERTVLTTVRANGATTGYVTGRAALLGRLRAMESAATRQQTATDTIAELGTHVGRRALVYVTNPGVSVPAGIRNAAAASGALIYHVGGDLGGNYIYADEESSLAGFPPGPSISAGSTGFVPLNTYTVLQRFGSLSIRDLRAEPSIHAALHDIAKDAEGYYDLEVSVPPGAATVNLRLNLKEDYQLSAQSYRLDHQSAPDIVLPK